MGQAETGTKGELIQLGLELGLNLSLEYFPVGMGVGLVDGAEVEI